MKKTIEKPLKHSKIFEYVRSIKQALKKTANNYQKKSLHYLVVKLVPDEEPKGKVLFSYIIDGFLLDDANAISSKHTNIWQSVQMANTFVELGYEVEVISWKNDTFLPHGEYVAFVDVRYNMERLAPLMNENCIKIAHIDTSHIVFHNAAEARRLLELQKRRGVTLLPRRYEVPNLLIDYTDYATTVGNEACIKTFKYANKKIFRLPTPCATTYDWDENKKWESARNNFLWFSSSGFVHKGLDLALEAFKDLPNHQLTICATLEIDIDFIEEYHEELFNLPNIETVGWVDIEGDKFKSIVKNSIAMLHTSCSEAGTGSVKMGMHAGLIPIISYETATDVEDFGITLKSSSIEEIQESVNYISSLSIEELKSKSRKAWEFARKNHTRELFAEKYKEVIEKLMP